MCYGLFCSSNIVVFNPKNGYRSYYLCVQIVSEQPVIVFLSVLNWFPSTWLFLQPLFTRSVYLVPVVFSSAVVGFSSLHRQVHLAVAFPSWSGPPCGRPENLVIISFLLHPIKKAENWCRKRQNWKCRKKCRTGWQPILPIYLLFIYL